MSSQKLVLLLCAVVYVLKSIEKKQGHTKDCDISGLGTCVCLHCVSCVYSQKKNKGATKKTKKNWDFATKYNTLVIVCTIQ